MLVLFIVLALASYRLTHLVVFDKIFEPIRSLFVRRSFVVVEDGIRAYYELQGGRIRRFVGSIMNCFWCSGIWTAAAVVLGFEFIPHIMILYLILAVAAVQSLLEQHWAKMVGFPEMMPKGVEEE